ncbi:hypothetical protein [Paenibacillus sp. HJGM_3]|uniref:hypothetical protein n=1 Tax=Paenibacillus sp. HJGM_3 TaxID=3379816 RepID=UPI00385ED632
MTNMLRMALLIAMFGLASCGRGTADQTNGGTPVPTAHIPTPTASSAPTYMPIPVPSAPEAGLDKADTSVRAVGKHPEGRLLVKPVSHARVAPLGAPSCYGLETDLRWAGDYEAVWESKATGMSTHILTFPVDFEIVQPGDAPVTMQKFTMEGTDIYYYVPRYTDCHGLETYFFGVGDGKAFPIPLELKPDLVWKNISQLPKQSLRIADGELILTGGYGAGQDFIDVYHFRYDPKKATLVLKLTEQVKPNEIVYD